MKTKNIFRILLVVVVLLLGANNVKADTITLWSDGSSSSITIAGSKFNNYTQGTLYVYTYSGQQLYIGTGMTDQDGEPLFFTQHNTWIRNYEYYNSNNHRFEFTLTSEMVTKIKTNRNLHLQNYSNDITLVEFVPDEGTSDPDPISPTTYFVTVNAGANGSAYTDPTSAAAGQTVTIFTSPISNYEVDAVTVAGVTVDEVSTNRYTFTMPANNVTVNVSFKPITYETGEYAQVNIGSTGYATFSNTSAISFASVSGLKAYIATAIDLDQNKVMLTQVKGTVAAGTGLILIRDNGIETSMFNLPKSSATGTSYSDNLLVASNAYTYLSHSDTSYTYYVLVQRGNVAKFAEVYDYDAEPGEGKAYLRISKVNHVQARTRSLSFEFSNGTTSISTVENEEAENMIYNLRGQRVENPTKGLYIINGKKVILK